MIQETIENYRLACKQWVELWNCVSPEEQDKAKKLYVERKMVDGISLEEAMEKVLAK